MLAAALILASLLAVPVPPDPAPEAAALRARATKAFQAKKYAEACPLFAKASEAEPKNGEIFADLGLCWDKAGDKAKAQAAGIQAAALGDAQTRLHAYYNLWKAGRALDRQTTAKNDKGETVPACITWTSDAACAQTLTACPYQEENRGTTFGSISSGIGICDDKEKARTYNQDGDSPTVGCFALIDKVIQETFCRPQDVCEDNVDQSKTDTPKCQAALAECLKHRETPIQADCTVVFVDACQKRVGAVCNKKAVELSPSASFSADDNPEKTATEGK